MIRNKSRTLDLATALVNRVELTAKEIKAIYNLKNPRRAIHYLRDSGVTIYSKPFKRAVAKNQYRTVVRYTTVR